MTTAYLAEYETIQRGSDRSEKSPELEIEKDHRVTCDAQTNGSMECRTKKCMEEELPAPPLHILSAQCSLKSNEKKLILTKIYIKPS